MGEGFILLNTLFLFFNGLSDGRRLYPAQHSTKNKKQARASPLTSKGFILLNTLDGLNEAVGGISTGYIYRKEWFILSIPVWLSES